MGYITEDKYLKSEIDGQIYCKDNGSFFRHIKSHGYDHRTYYETFITKKTETCPICQQSPKVFYKKESRYGDTCGDKKCAGKYHWLNKTPEKIKEIGEARSLLWAEKSDEQIADILKKRKDTLIANHGVDHPMKLDWANEKTRETQFIKYGVTHHAKLPEYKDKMKESYMKHLGVEHPMYDDVIKMKVSSSIKRKRYTEEQLDLLDDGDKFKTNYESLGFRGLCTKLGVSESCVYVYLRKHGIDVIKQPSSLFETDVISYIESLGVDDVIIGDRTILNGLELDIYSPSLKLAIECNGVYWHSELLTGKGKYYHKNKTDKCAEHGIQLLHITDEDWIEKNEIMKSLISTKVGNNTKIHARKCDIVLVSPKDVKEFLIKNHRQGWCQSSINYGLLYDGELVSIMTFGKSRYDKSFQYELLRFCNKTYTNVNGGASKLYKYFIKNHSPSSIISYSHNDWNNGGVYLKLGMTLFKNEDPSFVYLDNKRHTVNRQQLQKHKLSNILDIFDDKLTAWENLVQNGYDRIWNSGNKVYTWRDDNG